MKSSLLTVFGLVAAAAAQSSGDLPQCGVSQNLEYPIAHR